jgi:serine/threonine protein kinase
MDQVRMLKKTPYDRDCAHSSGSSGNFGDVDVIWMDGRRHARERLRNPTRSSARTLQEEVRITRSLKSHHHVMKILDAWCVTSLNGSVEECAFAMPLAESSLRDVIFSTKCLQAIKRVQGGLARGADLYSEFLRQCFGCSAHMLQFAHRRRVRHKDLKPENMLLWNDNGNSTLLITDFGLARDDFDTSALASKSQRSGIRTYWPPEVRTTKRGISGATFSPWVAYISTSRRSSLPITSSAKWLAIVCL